LKIAVILLILLAAFILLFCIVCLCGAVYLYRFGMSRRFRWEHAQPDNLWNELPPADEKTKSDPVWGKVRADEEWLFEKNRQCGVRLEMTSYDGLRLVAHYIPAENPRAIVLMSHGYRSAGIRDFACAARGWTEKNFGCCIVDHRAHQESEGDTICFGVKERYDIRDWARLLRERFPGVPVILDGVSMGASTVMYAAALELPDNVCGIIADCGYTTVGGIFEKVLRQWFNLPAFPLIPIAQWISRVRNGFGFYDIDAARCLREAKVPVLLAHGKRDDFVPYEMGEQIYAAVKDCIDVEFFSAEEAEHGLSYLIDPDGYEEALSRLYAKCLPPWEN